MTKCIKCKQEKEENDFISNRGNVREKCGSCCRQEFHRDSLKQDKDKKSKRMKSWISRNPDYMKEYRKKNNKKRTEYNKKWKAENREKHLARRKVYNEKIKANYPERYFLEKLRKNLAGVTRRAKSKFSLDSFGVNSTEEFIALMSAKTDNPNWVRDCYQLDHIWQLNWFDHKIKDLNFDFSLYSGLVNNHSNLRPLTATQNVLRSPLDFSPLNLTDLNKYRSVLNDFIIHGIEFYFANPNLFSGNPINKGDDEENILIKYLKGVGYKIDYYAGLRFSQESRDLNTNK